MRVNTGFIKTRKGFTLVELLIALALLLIAVALSFTFYFYITHSFKINTDKSQLQQSVRLTKSIVESKIVNSGNDIEIKILDEMPDSADLEEGDNIIYVDIDNGTIKHLIRKDDSNIVNNILTGNLSDNITMKLSFANKSKLNNTFLFIRVLGETEEDTYELASEVLFLNATIINEVDESGPVILFYSAE